MLTVGELLPNQSSKQNHMIENDLWSPSAKHAHIFSDVTQQHHARRIYTHDVMAYVTAADAKKGIIVFTVE